GRLRLRRLHQRPALQRRVHRQLRQRATTTLFLSAENQADAGVSTALGPHDPHVDVASRSALHAARAWEWLLGGGEVNAFRADVVDRPVDDSMTDLEHGRLLDDDAVTQS